MDWTFWRPAIEPYETWAHHPEMMDSHCGTWLVLMSFYCLLSNHRTSFFETFAFYIPVFVLPYYRKLTLHKKRLWKKEINAKERLTFHKKKKPNLLRRHEQSKTQNPKCKLCKRTRGYKRRNVATSRVLRTCFWRISSLIKYPSFLAVKNVRSVWRIKGQNKGN